jgi:GNAT superfamily N-acetyltransferase
VAPALICHKARVLRPKLPRMKFETLTLKQALPIVRDLLQENFNETGLPGRRLCVHEATYEALSEAGASFAVVAFDEDERAVGFASVFLSIHQHTSELCATNDTVFLLPTYRGTSLGGQLIVRAEREARKHGARLFLWQVVADTPIDRAFASRASSYNLFQRIYLKELQHG